VFELFDSKPSQKMDFCEINRNTFWRARRGLQFTRGFPLSLPDHLDCLKTTTLKFRQGLHNVKSLSRYKGSGIRFEFF